MNKKIKKYIATLLTLMLLFQWIPVYGHFNVFSKINAYAASYPTNLEGIEKSIDKIVGKYEGEYSASQGATGVSLNVSKIDEGNYVAEFYFYALPQNPGGATGKYTMKVIYSKENNKYFLKGESWIERPSGYGFANFYGKLDKNMFDGDVLNESGTNIGKFKLNKIDNKQLDKLLGEYNGTYTANQGITGLSLNVSKTNERNYVAEFCFYALKDNPKVKSGRYTMDVIYDSQNNKYFLKGDRWIEKPNEYVFVDFYGELSENIFSGSVLNGKDFLRSEIGKKTGSFKLSKKSIVEEEFKNNLNEDVFENEIVEYMLNNNFYDSEPVYEIFCNNYIVGKNGKVKWEIKGADTLSNVSKNFLKNIGDPTYAEIGNILLDIAKSEENSVYVDVKNQYVNVNNITNTFFSEAKEAGMMTELLKNNCDKIQLELVYKWLKNSEEIHNFHYWWDSGNINGVLKVFNKGLVSRFKASQIEPALKTIADNCENANEFIDISKKGFIIGKRLDGMLLSKLPSSVAKALNALNVGFITYDSVKGALFVDQINQQTIDRYKQIANDVSDPRIKDEIIKIIEKTEKSRSVNYINGLVKGVFDNYTTAILNVAVSKSTKLASNFLAEKAGEKLIFGSGIFVYAIVGADLGAVVSNLTMNANNILDLNIKIAAATRLKNELKGNLIKNLKDYMKEPTIENKHSCIYSLRNFYDIDILGSKYFKALVESHKTAIMQKVFRNEQGERDINDTINKVNDEIKGLTAWRDYIYSYRSHQLIDSNPKGIKSQLIERTHDVFEAMNSKDYKSLSKFVHPVKGLWDEYSREEIASADAISITEFSAQAEENFTIKLSDKIGTIDLKYYDVFYNEFSPDCIEYILNDTETAYERNLYNPIKGIHFTQFKWKDWGGWTIFEFEEYDGQLFLTNIRRFSHI